MYGGRVTKTTDLNSYVAAELRAVAARRGTTYRSLAAELGVAEKTISRYLLGRRAIPMDFFGAFCDAMDTEPGEVTAAAWRAMRNDARKN